jgi:hypothetical protein
LGFVDFFTRTQWAVGIANFNGANFLDALSDRLFSISGAWGCFVGRCDVKHQTNDDEHGDDERSKAEQKHLLGRFHRAGVGFVLIVAVIAHEILL